MRFICTFLRELPFPTQANLKPSNFTFFPLQLFIIDPSNYEITAMLIYRYLGVPLNRAGGNPAALDHFQTAAKQLLWEHVLLPPCLGTGLWFCIFQLLLCVEDGLTVW